MTTDITELAQREKFEAWAEHACAAPWGYLKKRRTSEGYSEQIYTCMWTAWKAANAELVKALEKAKQHIARQEQILLNQDESLSIRRGELEAAQQERENWHTSFDNERFRADKLAATLSNEIEQSANVRGQLLIAHKTLLNQQAKIAEMEEAEQKLCAANLTLDARAELAERQLAKMESRTVKLPELCVGVVQGGHAVMVPYAAGHWFNKTAILEMLAAAGIKWEAE